MLDLKLGKSPDPRVSKEAEYTRNIYRLLEDLFPKYKVKFKFEINHLTLDNKEKLLSALFCLRRLKVDRFYKDRAGLIATATKESVKSIIHNPENAERS